MTRKNHYVINCSSWCAKRCLIMCCCLYLSLSTKAQSLSQSVIGNAGDFFSEATVGNLHWTIGEIAVETYSSGDILTQGFHQTYPDLISTSTWEHEHLNFDIQAFPNPTVDWLNIQTNYKGTLQYFITNLLGQSVSGIKVFETNTQANLSDLAAGMYLLVIQKDGQFIKTFKIQKTLR